MAVSGVSLAESRRGVAPVLGERLPFSRRHPVLWRLWRRKLGLVGLGVVVLVALAAIFAPWVAPHDPLAQELKKRFAGPGTSGYLLGADAFGRDILSRL